MPIRILKKNKGRSVKTRGGGADAGIVLPFLIPKDFLKAPGFLIAF